MSRFTGGWVKVHRRMVDDDIGDSGINLSIWLVLISWANVKPSKMKRGGVQTILPIGSLVTSSNELGDKLGFSRKTVDKALKYLRVTGRISMKRDNHGTVVTICNYEKYQVAQPVDGTAGVAAGYTAGVAAGYTAGVARIEEEKKERRKEEKKDIGKPPKTSLGAPTYSTAEYSLAEKWAKHAVEMYPHLRPDIATYAKSIHGVKKSAKLNDEQMAGVFAFVAADEFWAPNCASPVGLLKRRSKGGMRKIDNILAAIKKTHYGHVEVMAWAAAEDAKREQRQMGLGF